MRLNDGLHFRLPSAFYSAQREQINRGEQHNDFRMLFAVALQTKIIHFELLHHIHEPAAVRIVSDLSFETNVNKSRWTMLILIRLVQR